MISTAPFRCEQTTYLNIRGTVLLYHHQILQFPYHEIGMFHRLLTLLNSEKNELYVSRSSYSLGSMRNTNVVVLDGSKFLALENIPKLVDTSECTPTRETSSRRNRYDS